MHKSICLYFNPPFSWFFPPLNLIWYTAVQSDSLLWPTRLCLQGSMTASHHPSWHNITIYIRRVVTTNYIKWQCLELRLGAKKTLKKTGEMPGWSKNMNMQQVSTITEQRSDFSTHIHKEYVYRYITLGANVAESWVIYISIKFFKKLVKSSSG